MLYLKLQLRYQIFDFWQPPEGMHVVLAFLPMHHTYGLHMYAFRSCLACSTLALIPKWDVKLALKAIPKYAYFAYTRTNRVTDSASDTKSPSWPSSLPLYINLLIMPALKTSILVQSLASEAAPLTSHLSLAQNCFHSFQNRPLSLMV